MDYTAIAVGGVSVVFAAGAYVDSLRRTKRDLNGLGRKVRDNQAAEERHHRDLLAFLVQEPDATERAKIMADLLRRV